MKATPIAVALLLAALATAAPAQTLKEDVRCILLSGMFIKSAKDEKGQQIAKLTGAFHLGRIDARTDAKALTEALRAESKTIDPKAAGPAMDACAARLGKAQAAMNGVGRSAAAGK